MSLAGRLEIDLDAIAGNWRALDTLSAPEVETAAVVKADAYGCGATRVGPALARAGVRTFFVALPAEGIALRQALGTGPAIYILAGYAPAPSSHADGPPPPNRVRDPEGASAHAAPSLAGEPPPPLWACGGTAKGPVDLSPTTRDGERGATRLDAATYRAHNLRPVLNSAAQAVAWFRDAPGQPCAIQLDSGMNRLGMEPGEFASLGPLPEAVHLVMSHFACADEPGHPLTPAQVAAFRQMTDGISRPRSLSATAGILLGPEVHFDMTRAGIGIYGGLPFAAARPVVALSLPIIQIRDLAPGEQVGYGGTWTATRPSRIATLAGGYCDGLIRAMGNRARGFLRGQPLPFAGRVSMDLITLDITDCGNAVDGDMVEILGEHQTIDTLAASAGTIGHEILTSLGGRYERIYHGG